MYRILVVDDEREIVNVIGKFLSIKGFEVVKAYGGVEALEIITKVDERIDLVILDKKMPNVNGITVLKEIKSKRSDLPVVLLTGSIDMHLLEDAKAMGYTDYLIKPVHFEELLEKINKRLAKEGE